MRYLLIVAGLFSLLMGVGFGHAIPAWIMVGAVFLAVGLATVDIVQAIKDKRP
jgi:hypothetical protein